MDVDGASGGDNPWDFGTSSQYPVLKFGLTPADQRATLSVSVSPNSICETTKGSDTAACGASPVTSATLTATLSPAQEVPVTLTFNTDAAVYTLTGNPITIAAGQTIGTMTITAVNNKTIAADKSVTLTPTNSQHWITKPAAGGRPNHQRR